MKKVCLLILFLAFHVSFNSSFAQLRRSYTRVGAFVGISNYQGDLSGTNIDAVQFTRPAIGIMAAKQFTSVLGIRLALTQGWLFADDNQTSTSEAITRRLSFRTSITEISCILTLDLIPTNRDFQYRPLFTPYVFGGVGVFAFNPQTEFAGNFVDLQPLGTEGQFLPDPLNEYPDPYRLVQASFPVGFGIKFVLNRQLSLEVETGIRVTMTDYIDDVSTFYPDLEELRAQRSLAAILSYRGEPDNIRAGAQRGGQDVNDYYAFTGVTISYILDFVKCPMFR